MAVLLLLRLSLSLSLSLCLLQPSLTITRHHHSQVNHHSRRLWWCCCRPLPLNSVVGKHRRRLRRSSNLSQRRSENRGVGVRVYRCGCGSSELRSEPVHCRNKHRRGRGVVWLWVLFENITEIRGGWCRVGEEEKIGCLASLCFFSFLFCVCVLF
ncbi:hypothetical protein HanXRQr2_Chr05g0209681 [Helianthus annuus]|uniref:Secreted protein n=1 Tax=Helianthus annuus TaxID=4232 RepID=A0A9K3IYL0_HELAN|nr:hypothetical protein HanXRQr2_Chr05g0209681 [Helianthus annuus]